MTIDDFVRNRWADAKEALRELDPDYVSTMETLLGLDRSGLLAPPDMVAKSDKQPRKRLSKRWHGLLEACFELTVITRNYLICYGNLTSEAVRRMDDVEAGRLFMFGFYTSLSHKAESSSVLPFWIPAFAGMTANCAVFRTASGRS